MTRHPLATLAVMPAWAMQEGALRSLLAQTTHAHTEPRAAEDAMRAGVGVAVLRVRGVIDQHLSWFADVSTDHLSRQLRAALAMPEIGAIVLDVASPGGGVFGTPEFAAELFAARSQKPIYAVANSYAASAAYWIASAATEFYVAPSGEVGSIGCWMLHLDYSQYLEQAGIAATVIRSGKYKAEGNPYEPLTAEALDHKQAGVDRYHTMFINAVAKYRGASVATVRAEFGEGRMLGAKDAVAAGMVNGIATYDEVIAKAAKAATSRVRAPRAEDVDVVPDEDERDDDTPDDEPDEEQARRAAAADIDRRRRVAALVEIARPW